jgi:hypothetical protein
MMRAMVEVASRVALPVGLMPWTGYETAATLILKATFSIGGNGSISLAPTQKPLSLEVRAPDGTVTYPSDFVPHKAAIDVLVVGEAARVNDPPASLSFGAMSTTTQQPGPIAAYDARDEKWSASDFDFARFQSAQPAQRLLQLALPAQLAFSRGDVSLKVRVDPPSPSMRIVQRAAGGWTNDSALDVALTCDTVVLDPRDKTIVAIFRGFADPGRTWGDEMLIVVNPLGSLNGVNPNEISAWHHEPAVSFDEMEAAPEGFDGRETVAVVGGGARAVMPFVAGRFQPPSSNRSQPSSAASDDDEERDPLDDAGTGTMPIGAVSPVRAYVQSQAAPPSAARPPSGTVPLPSLSREQIERIRAELRAAPHMKRQILDRYSLSEMVWMAIAGSD